MRKKYLFEPYVIVYSHTECLLAGQSFTAISVPNKTKFAGARVRSRRIGAEPVQANRWQSPAFIHISAASIGVADKPERIT